MTGRVQGDLFVGGDVFADGVSLLPFTFGDTAPVNASEGHLWFDTNSTPPVVKFYDGSAWQTVQIG